MTCEEFERVLPELEGDRTFEQEQHLRTCSLCAGLVADLRALSQQAGLLRNATEEPSPRVWNSIEIALREEGLIREQPFQSSRARVGASLWRPTWLVPALAALLLVFGLVLHRAGNRPTAKLKPAAANLSADAGITMVPEEVQLLQAVAARAPGLRSSYESDLRQVDAYISDAERSVRSNPNDEIAQQYLMNAYEQKAMVYEMAMERSQP